MVNTPNMNLQLPVIGVDTGITWEQAVNNNSTVLDSHNHSPGSGVPITPLGLNINTDVTFQNHSATNLYGISFGSPASSSLTSFLYTAAQSGGGIYDLFFNDGAGNVIPITKAGIVNTVASSIPGESYAGGTFTWKQGTGSTTPANFDIGSVVLRPNIAATTNGITLSPPSGISSAYSLVLPALPPGQQIVTLDASGNITAPYTVDNSTIAISANVIQVKDLGITTAKIANGAVGATQLAPKNIAVNGSTGTNFISGQTALTQINGPATITTFGRPVHVYLTSDGTTNDSGVYLTNTSGSTNNVSGRVLFLVGSTFNTATVIFSVPLVFYVPGGGNFYALLPPESFRFTYIPAAGTYSYWIAGKLSAATGVSMQFYYMKFVAEEDYV